MAHQDMEQVVMEDMAHQGMVDMDLHMDLVMAQEVMDLHTIDLEEDMEGMDQVMEAMEERMAAWVLTADMV